MPVEALDLARLQFAFTIAFHIIFPAFTIGLASYLAVLNFLHLRTGEALYLRLFDYWKTIFAVTFGMGVVSGLTMSYQFGTNWSAFSDRAGPIVGPLMGYEVLSAFFLEAGFLGIMLFGRPKVGPGLHFLATAMVAIGTLGSAFWILSANSWMQTPAGYAINPDGQFAPEDWWAAIFNPSFPYRLVHMVLAAYLTTALVVGAVGAWHLLRDAADPAARRMFAMAMGMIVVVAPIQIVAGDLHGLNTIEHQPAKIAAMEGHYETRAGAPLILFGLPDDAAETTRYALEIPRLGSLILTHHWDGEVQGLKAFPRDERPPAALIFWTFRIMVGLGLSHARPRRLGGLAALAGPARLRPLAAARRARHGADGLRRAHLRLDHHRGRAPALDGLRPAAHRRQRLADRGAGGGDLAHRLCRRLLRGVRSRHLLPAAADAPATRGGAGHRGTGPDPRRHHGAAEARALRRTARWNSISPSSGPD